MSIPNRPSYAYILSCPSKSNSNTFELTVHTSCYWGLRLTLCYYLFSELLVKCDNVTSGKMRNCEEG